MAPFEGEADARTSARDMENVILCYLFYNPESLPSVERLCTPDCHQILVGLKFLDVARPPVLELLDAANLDRSKENEDNWNTILRIDPMAPEEFNHLREEYQRKFSADMFIDLGEEKPAKIDYEEIQALAVSFIKGCRQAPIAAELINDLKRKQGIDINRSTFLRRVIKPLLKDERIYKLEPKNRLSPYVLDNPLVLESDNWDVDDTVQEVYPILPVFNGLLGGGIVRGEVVLIHQMSGSGKSYLFLSCAVNAVMKLGLTVKYIDMELGKGDLDKFLRHILHENNLSGHKMKDTALFSYQHMKGRTIPDHYIEEACREFDVVIVDYLTVDGFFSGKEATKMGTVRGAAVVQPIARHVKKHNCFFISGTQIHSIPPGGHPDHPIINLQGGNTWKNPASIELSVFEQKYEEDTKEYVCRASCTKCRGLGQTERKMKPGKNYTYTINSRTTEYLG